jgi:hypothetical protein
VYALAIEKVSRNVPPLLAVMTIIPALGGPLATSFQSASLKSAFAVIGRSFRLRPG